MEDPERVRDAVVVGAGQAGLAASYFLTRRGIDHLVLDANAGPGGAWRHRWDSLAMVDVHGVADLPGAPAPARSDLPANVVVPDWFAAYEQRLDLPVVRPVRVDRVEDDGGILVVRAGGRRWRTRTLVNATGTWTRPFVPSYPGPPTSPASSSTPPTTPARRTSAGVGSWSWVAGRPRSSCSASWRR